MSDSLPPLMLARLTRLGTALTTWAAQHPGAALAEQETAVLTLVRTALPDLLLAMLSLTTPALARRDPPVPHRCPTCQRWVPLQSWRDRQLATQCGRVRIRRPWYACQACGHGFSPVDTTLAVAPATHVSGGLRDWLVRLGATTSFREAAALLATLTGLTSAPETIRRHTEAVGSALAVAQAAAVAQVMATQEAATTVDPAPGMLVVEADGVMVRYRDGWHEVKVGVVAGQQAGALVAPSYVAAREPPERFGPRLLTEAARRGALTVIGWTGPRTGRGLAVLRPVVVLGDGAAWIWNLAADHFGDRTEIVDFYHAAEHLWEVAHALYDPDPVAITTWAQARRQDLVRHGPAPVLAALAREQPATAAARTAVQRLRGYLTTHRARMDYPAFRARGFPIGSGAVESSARHLVQQRLKRAGCRWSVAGAHALLAVRAHHASHQPLAA